MPKVSNVQNETDQPSFEQSRAKLQTLVQQLEDGELSMDQALAAYEQGIGHLKRCYQLLEAAEQKVQLLTGVDEAGDALTQEFVEEA